MCGTYPIMQWWAYDGIKEVHCNAPLVSVKQQAKMGHNIMRNIYLGNEAMNEKHRAHSKCGQQEMLPSHWHRKTNSLKATENHLQNPLSLSQLTTQFDSHMLL